MHPKSRRSELKDSELLLPFEMDSIPDIYKEYYKTKRNNFFASLQLFAPTWEVYQKLDEIWCREFDQLSPPGDSHQYLPVMLYANAHAKIRISIELAFTGCLMEARSILRDAVESTAHAHLLSQKPELQKTWLNKSNDEEAFKKEFIYQKKARLFRGLDELYKAWCDLSDTGSHSTLKAIVDRFHFPVDQNGTQSWNFLYTGADERHWSLSLFSMLLKCVGMEYVFFEDYGPRLHLDHVLVGMRQQFEVHKERLREALKKHYSVKKPEPKATIIDVEKDAETASS